MSGTILGPLTTTFTPPASCSYNLFSCDWCQPYFSAYSSAATSPTTATVTPRTMLKVHGAKTCASQNIQDQADCWPPRSGSDDPSKTSSPPATLSGWGVYSPGIACPAGYAPACSATGQGAADFQFQFTPEPSETAIGCCPLDFTCTTYSLSTASFAPQTCIRAISTASFVLGECDRHITSDANFTTVPLPTMFPVTSSNVVLQYTATSFVLFAPLIQLMQHPSDLALSTAPPSSPSSTASLPEPTSSTSSSPTAAATVGLSSGAVAGIVVGVVAGVALVSAIAILVWRKRRHAKKNETTNKPVEVAANDVFRGSPSVYPGSPSVFITSPSAFRDKTEVPPHELPGSSVPITTAGRYEM